MSLLAGIKILWKQMGKQILSEEHVLAEVVSLGCRCRHLKLAPPGSPEEERKQKHKYSSSTSHTSGFLHQALWKCPYGGEKPTVKLQM